MVVIGVVCGGGCCGWGDVEWQWCGCFGIGFEGTECVYGGGVRCEHAVEIVVRGTRHNGRDWEASLCDSKALE